MTYKPQEMKKTEAEVEDHYEEGSSINWMTS